MFRIPTNTTSVTSLLQAPQQNERVNIYLGDGGTPEKNDFMSLLGSYVHRVANTSKDLQKYPIVFASETALTKFQQYKAQMTQQFGTVQRQKTGISDDNVGCHLIYALQNVTTFHASDFTFNDKQKIYIHGHGGAGINSLHIDTQKLSMPEVAKAISDMGVPKTTKDIRLTSCYSADTKPITNIKADDLSTYSESHTQTSSFFGITVSQKTIQAPAKYLLDALNDEGYKDVTVTGYHGAGNALR